MKNLLNNVPIISSETLKSGVLIELLPELYEQKQTIEINPWHNHQSVFDHTISVVEAVEYIYKFEFLFKNSRDTIWEYLSTQQYGYTVKDISLFVALLHDIGKKQTLVTDTVTSQTNCPNHEQVSSNLAKLYVPRFGVGARTVNRICKLIQSHGDIHRVVNTILMKNEPEKEFMQFKNRVKNEYILYLIQGYADTLGSDLPTLQLHEFKKREIIYREAINRFVTSL